MSGGHDARLVPAAVAVWAATWVVPALAARPWVVLAAVLAVAGGGLLLVRGRRWVAAVAAAAFAVAALVCLVHVAADRGGPLAALADDRATAHVQAVVTGEPRTLGGRVRGDRRAPDQVFVDVTVEVVTARGRTTRVVTPVSVLAAPDGWAGLARGTRIAASGRLAREPDGSVLLRAQGPPQLVAAPSAWLRAAARVRHGLRKASEGLSADARALLPGLVVGDTAGMPDDLQADFRISGLTHLTAVSGGNLAIVVGAALWAARWCGVRGRWLVLLAGVALGSFVVVAGPDPSVLRAAVMGAVGLLALVGGRARRGLPALAAAVVLLLLVDPYLARSYGFALSVLATAGLVLLARPWGRRLGERLAALTGRCGWPRVARALGPALAVPVAAQLAVAPVLVLLAPQVSLVSVPANLLAAPAVAPATVLGLVAAILSLVSPALAAAVAAVAAWPVTWVADVGHAFARVPGGVLPWLPGPVGAALLTAAIGAAAVLVRRRARAGRQGVASAPARLVAVALVGVAGLVVVGARLPTVLSGPWPPAGWVLVACDVGQGDALVLPAGDDEAVVVDAGPDPQAVDDCLDELGVRRVALLVLTHLHADHVEGVPGVLSGRRVDQVLVGPYGEPAAEQRRVAAWTAARAPVRVAHPGDTWHAGATSLRVLWPSRVIEEESVPNNASIVLRVDVGDVRLLLTGDVEPPAQRALLAGPLRAPGILPVDVLKVPHHGSAAQMPGLLAGIGARVGVISVGAGNDYGHPAPSTVTALRRAGILVERTDRDGAVAVVGPAERLRVVEH